MVRKTMYRVLAFFMAFQCLSVNTLQTAAEDELSFTINANISFEQIIESEIETETNETP